METKKPKSRLEERMASQGFEEPLPKTKKTPEEILNTLKAFGDKESSAEIETEIPPKTDDKKHS